jgi:hypothetical protein
MVRAWAALTGRRLRRQITTSKRREKRVALESLDIHRSVREHRKEIKKEGTSFSNKAAAGIEG